ncbi:MAG TPA: heme exporter protein CcmB [Anaerolineales bacterium]|nr:heme exporter protein CcmB [Anaerolineales bacterium]
MLTILRKDLATELRSREVVSAMLVFAILMVLIFNFALELDKNARENVAVGALWATFLFAGTLGLNRIFASEADRTGMDALLLAPMDRSAIFFGKWLGAFLFILLVQAIILPIFTILYGVSLWHPLFLGLIVLGTIGYSAVGTLLAAIALQTRMREVLLPILLLPVSIPLLLSAVKGCQLVLENAPWGDILPAVSFLIAYDAIFLAIAYMTFDYLMEE